MLILIIIGAVILSLLLIGVIIEFCKDAEAVGGLLIFGLLVLIAYYISIFLKIIGILAAFTAIFFIARYIYRKKQTKKLAKEQAMKKTSEELVDECVVKEDYETRMKKEYALKREAYKEALWKRARERVEHRKKLHAMMDELGIDYKNERIRVL